MVPGVQRDPVDVVPVLMYHDVAEPPVSRAFRRFVVSPALFVEHLIALNEGGYKAGRVREVPDLRGPRQVVVVTFDDGFATIVEQALPALAERSMTATIFLPSAFVGGRATWLSSVGEEGRRLLTWQDARDAVAAGFEIGSHGQRHLELDVLDVHGLEEELVVSKGILEDETSSVVQSLAYPFGYHDRRVRAAAAGAGYSAACEVGYGLHQRGHDPFRIRRLQVGPDVSGERLLELVTDGEPTVEQRARRYAGPVWRLARRTRALARGRHS
jgi:peptidoglycan/xylan/chitin deacetylase (PgdA/CDA1 family)